MESSEQHSIPAQTGKFTSPVFWRSILIEIPVFYLLNFGLEHLFFGHISGWYSLAEAHIPHPYWLGIILFGLVYGFFEGVLTGSFAALIVIYFFPGYPHWNPLEWGTLAILPISFITVGAFVGTIQVTFIEKIIALSKEKQKLTSQVNSLDSLVSNLTETNLDLEKRIVTRWETFNTLYEIAEKLTNLQLSEILEAVPEIIASFSQATICSLYLYEKQDVSLHLKSTFGWPSRTYKTNLLTTDSPEISLLLGQTKTRVIEPLELENLGIDGYFILALVDEEGDTLGMITIDEISYSSLTPDTRELLVVLSNWISNSISNGLRFVESEKSSFIDHQTKLIKEKLLWSRAQKVVTTAVRQNHDVTLLMLYIEYPPEATQEEKDTWTFEIAQTVKKICRSDDELSVAEEESPYQFLLMFPFCDKQNAMKLIRLINLALLDLMPAIEEDNIYFCFYWDLFSLKDGSLFLGEKIHKKLQFI